MFFTLSYLIFILKLIIIYIKPNKLGFKVGSLTYGKF